MAERIRAGLSAPVAIGDGQTGGHRQRRRRHDRRRVDSSPAALLRDADNAMYEAKRSGRDQVVLFHSNAREAWPTASGA